MSRRSINFCIDEDASRYVEISIFDDAERGEWGMSYKLHHPDAVEAADSSHKRKRADDDHQ
jgi:hypothetical protein